MARLHVAAMSALLLVPQVGGRLSQDAAVSAAPLSGQVAVATGASRGSGKAIAVHLARQGAATAGIVRAGPDLAALRREADGAAGRLCG